MADGERVKALHTARGLTIVALAKAAGVTRPTVYAAEAGRPVDLDTCVKLAAALGVPLSEISPEAARAVEAVA